MLRGVKSSRTLYTSPVLAVANARILVKAEWDVHITDADGGVFHPRDLTSGRRRGDPSDFDPAKQRFRDQDFAYVRLTYYVSGHVATIRTRRLHNPHPSMPSTACQDGSCVPSLCLGIADSLSLFCVLALWPIVDMIEHLPKVPHVNHFTAGRALNEVVHVTFHLTARAYAGPLIIAPFPLS